MALPPPGIHSLFKVNLTGLLSVPLEGKGSKKDRGKVWSFAIPEGGGFAILFFEV